MKKVICFITNLERMMTEECTFCHSVNLCDFKSLTNKNALDVE
jgi:hypothetical protein